MLSADLPTDHLIWYAPVTSSAEKSAIGRFSLFIAPSPLIPGREHPAITAMAANSKTVILFISGYEPPNRSPHKGKCTPEPNNEPSSWCHRDPVQIIRHREPCSKL